MEVCCLLAPINDTSLSVNLVSYEDFGNMQTLHFANMLVNILNANCTLVELIWIK